MPNGRINKTTRVIAFAVLVCLVVFSVCTVVFVAEHSRHNCTGAQCETCVALLAGCGAEKPAISATAAAPPHNDGRAEAGAGPSANPESESLAASTPHEAAFPQENNGEIIEITEKLFIAQTNDIYLNGNDYLGKTIRYEGLYKNNAEWAEGGEPITHFVIRYGPGCCGYDGEAGFEVRWGEDVPEEWPEVDDWVEVIGILREEAYPSGYKILFVELTSLTVKEERGAEYVAT